MNMITKTDTGEVVEQEKYMSDSIVDLASALALAQSEIHHAERNSENPYYKANYADLSSIMDASREPLTKNGLSVTQIVNYNDTTNIFLITLLLHKSGQWLKSFYPIKPVKKITKDSEGNQVGVLEPTPQDLGSAITYARRYAYASIVGVCPKGDDDDGNKASNKTVEEKKNGYSKPAAQSQTNFRWPPTTPKGDWQILPNQQKHLYITMTNSNMPKEEGKKWMECFFGSTKSEDLSKDAYNYLVNYFIPNYVKIREKYPNEIVKLVNDWKTKVGQTSLPLESTKDQLIEQGKKAQEDLQGAQKVQEPIPATLKE